MSPEDQRPDPDVLLAQIARQEQAGKGGKLFIFLGMCPGVGKTYAMLQTARQRHREDVNVLVGIAETHGRSETAALLEGLRVLPRKKIEYRDHILEEFDIDAALDQQPELILVDELAHTNVPGSRHAKRYQDVLELLDAGIDVYTTLNVQHIESQVDIVRQISGVGIQETVPDSILDRAHEIQLIDLSVEKLLDRMAEGKVYLGERAERAVSNFFKEGNLTALRELALRFTAEQVDRALEDIRRARRVSSPWKTNARLLVGVGPSPHGESLIRWTRRAANRLGCPWIVASVEGSKALTTEEQERLTRTLGLARRLGAEVVSITGDNVPQALLGLARERNVSQIIVGKPGKPRFWKKSMADRLILDSADIDICVVRPMPSTERSSKVSRIAVPPSESVVGEYSWAFVGTFVLVSLCWALAPVTGYMFVALVFLLAVVLAALRFRRGPVLAMASLLALAWNYFFIPPLFTFYIRKPEDVVMFVIFFIVALSMGHLTTRLRQREEAERRRLRLTSALLRVTQSAALAAESARGLADALRTINELLNAETALIVRQTDRSLPHQAHPASTFKPRPKEWGVIVWSYENKQAGGRFTDTLPESDATWFPLQTSTSMMGVLGISLPKDAGLDFTTRQMIEAFALQLALVLEKEHFIQAMRHAELTERSEQLHRTLLDSVSHELKTPLSVIRASLDGMGAITNPYVEEMRGATERLQQVVDNLLQMTRLESEVLQPRLDWASIPDIIASARNGAGTAFANRTLNLHVPEDAPLIKVDAALLAQALANLLRNAACYTPAGTLIEVSLHSGDGAVRLIVRDHGPGLPVGTHEKVFEKFYRVPGSPPGGTGLGLAIARGLVRAQGGDITARNHPDGGAEFTVELRNIERTLD